MDASEDSSPGLTPSPPELARPHGPLDPVPVEVVPPPERRNRAGRDLRAAIAVGLLLGGLVIASLYVVRVAFVAVAVAAVVVGLRELTGAMATKGIALPFVPVVVGGIVIVVASYAGGVEALVVGLALAAMAVAVWRLPLGAEGYVRDVTAGIFALAYVPFLVGFAMLLLRAEDGADRVVVYVLVTACSDIGGYAAGVLLGRHPMAPSISPKKSWEGFTGSVLFCAWVGAIACATLLGAAWWHGALLGVAAATTATVGDLGESMVKRDLGIKDMGSVLPGHGGLMDRLDSLLPNAPVFYLALSLAVGAGAG